jgi:hypothetical protein
LDRKALVPAPPPGEGTKPHPRMSTRAATWLVVVAGLLVVYHYAHGGALPSANVPVIAPALHVALRGEVTTVTASKLVVRVEDTQGGLTNLNRTIALGPTTHYQSPGQPSISGAHGLTYIKPGYRVLVHGLSASDGQTVNAAQVSVSFPPVTGTLQSIAGSDLVVSVRGQAQPMVIQASSRTAFFVPNGRWSTLASGVPVRVWIAPEPKDPQHFNALTVTVQPR